MERVNLGQWDIVDEDGNTFACLIRERESTKVSWVLTDTNMRRLEQKPFPDQITAGKFYAVKMGGKFSSSKVRPKAKKPR